MDFFSQKRRNERRTRFLWFWQQQQSDTGDKNRDYRTNWIEWNTSCTSLFDVYPAIFIQLLFFCDFYTVFFAHLINLIGLNVFLYFSKAYSYFQGWFYKIPVQFQDKRHYFQILRVFQDQGKIFPGLCELCKSMSHIICHINPQIHFVDICCGHGMSLSVFIH